MNDQEATEILCGPERPPARGHIGYDFGNESSIQFYQCGCGFQCNDVEAIVVHMRGHGVTAVTVEPVSSRPR